MTNLTTTAYATAEDKEFQLKRIKEARKLLDTYENLIKENKQKRGKEYDYYRLSGNWKKFRGKE